jgi:hypothetical protein
MAPSNVATVVKLVQKEMWWCVLLMVPVKIKWIFFATIVGIVQPGIVLIVTLSLTSLKSLAANVVANGSTMVVPSTLMWRMVTSV